MAERLHRLERVYENSPVYFIPFCVEGRKPILAHPELHAAFIRFSQQALARDVFVGRYILMPDHVHLFVKLPPPAANFSAWMKNLKNFLSKKLNELGRAAPHWQKGFFDHILRSGESYSAKWLYMVGNPVRAALVKSWTEWPYQGEIYPLRFD
ncbi:MAG: transposase [Verrucomicrobia bacterium]|jgi:REP element-mobilizing transposase RayT|nr:transposase [Verrucomicrobiota bacterium]